MNPAKTSWTWEIHREFTNSRFPAGTTERKTRAKAEAETGKIAIRNIRKEANEKIRKLKSEGVSEDEMKVGEGEIQKLTDAYIIKVDVLSDAKEKDIMTV